MEWLAIQYYSFSHLAQDHKSSLHGYSRQGEVNATGRKEFWPQHESLVERASTAGHGKLMQLVERNPGHSTNHWWRGASGRGWSWEYIDVKRISTFCRHLAFAGHLVVDSHNTRGEGGRRKWGGMGEAGMNSDLHWDTSCFYLSGEHTVRIS